MAVLAQLVDGVVATRFELVADGVTLGRHPDNQVQIDDDAVSGWHAVVLVESNSDFNDYKEYYLEDLNSTNGTFINDKKVNGKVRLNHNDVIRLAWNRFRFMEETAAVDRTMHMLSDT